jgi:ribosomal protein S18 acetylase RimI-like enzyme
MIKITRAKITDAQSIRKLEFRVWKEEVTSEYDAPMFVRFGWCFVARDGQKVIGAICSYLTNKDEVYVCDWVVDKLYRQRNIGGRLYQKLIETVKHKNVISLINPKNKPSLTAHQKLGFKVVGFVKNAYGLRGGLEGGSRILVRLKSKS